MVVRQFSFGVVPLVSSLCTGTESENSRFIAANLSRFLLCYIHEAAYKWSANTHAPSNKEYSIALQLGIDYIDAEIQ
jgi:hypothetical protein